MLNFKIILENNISYLNTGNIFSKSLIIKENLEEKKCILVVVENEKVIENYEKIFNLIGLNIIKIKEQNDIVDLFFNREGLFFLNADFLNEIIPNNDFLLKKSLQIEKNEEFQIDNIIKELNNLGFVYSDFNKSGSFRKTGDVLTINDFKGQKQYKISFWGDIVEEIFLYDIFKDFARSHKKVDKIFIGSNKEVFSGDSIKNQENYKSNSSSIIENLKNVETRFIVSEDKQEKMGGITSLQNRIFTILDSINFSKNYELANSNIYNFCLFDFIKNDLFKTNNLEIDYLNTYDLEELKEILSNKIFKTKHIFTKSVQTIKNFLEYNNIEKVIVHETNLNILKSFKYEKSGIIIICDDIISKVFIRKRIKRNFSKDLDLLLKIKIGDYIVHIDHGIGIFKGIINKELGNIKKEYIEIEYKDNDKLFVPITEVVRVNKYLGSENPKLTGLNTKEWNKKLEKAGKDIRIIAKELLEIYSQRKIHQGFNFIRNKEKESEFRNSFSYIYTNCQENAIEEILSDMNKPIPMDRLLIGDVGFGKTEIAFNAIYNAFLNKKQSILVAPLVVLAYEHFDKALDRFRNFGLKIEVLTRFESQSKTNEVLKGLESGKLDLVVGTHKLLSEKIVYKNLGLLVLDEEHKFGVEDKEKIKKLKTTIDVLSMSATPIPRSLNMALSSIKGMSILKNPPFGRQSIETVVGQFNERTILIAGNREFERGGQIFFIHNRVSNIENIKKILLNIFPDKKIIITHGQLPGDELEKRIIDFKHKKYDILLSTTVVENGIDFSNVNTIFINEATNFGISSIHQLRGRVGRSDKKGYCYLLYKNDTIKEDGAKRLKTIVEYSYLGAGFELAMKDLEIRGGGDILGIKQSGQTADIGINLFLEMLEDKVEEMKNDIDNKNLVLEKGEIQEDKQVKKIETSIDLNISAFINDEYFSSDLDKINFYREIESINNIEDLDYLIEDFKLVNPNFTKEINNLFGILRLKIKGNSYKIKSIKKIGINYQIDFSEEIKLEELKRFLTLDTKVNFVVIGINRLRSPTKNFKNDEDFMEYLLSIFDNKVRKIVKLLKR